MTDREFELLDEIYMMLPYNSLAHLLGWEDEVILATLQSLLNKGWIRCYTTPTEEIEGEIIDLANCYRNYLYLASKDGLIAHNSME